MAKRAAIARNLLGAALACFGLLLTCACADDLRLAGPKLLDTATGENVTLSEDGSSVILARGILIEDDGPAAGYSYRPNEERLAGDVQIKKELLVADPRAKDAWLLVGPGGDLTAHINGREQRLADPAKAGGYWQQYRLPADAFRIGTNEV